MNSREKGKRGERQWRDELRAQGYAARRGQQFSGSPDSPDVVCDALDGLHFEVKCVERLNIEDAMEQARRDALREGAERDTRGGCGPQKIPIVAHKRNFCRWLVTMDADDFFKFLRGEFDTSPLIPMTPSPPLGRSSGDLLQTEHSFRRSSPEVPVRGGEGNGAHGVRRPTSTDFPATACAVATNENNKPKEKNENPS